MAAKRHDYIGSFTHARTMPMIQIANKFRRTVAATTLIAITYNSPFFADLWSHCFT